MNLNKWYHSVVQFYNSILRIHREFSVFSFVGFADLVERENSVVSVKHGVVIYLTTVDNVDSAESAGTE